MNYMNSLNCANRFSSAAEQYASVYTTDCAVLDDPAMPDSERTNQLTIRNQGKPSTGTAPRSTRGQKRRVKILKAAADLFLEYGYGETSIDAIVERSGGSKATLYNYFPTKEDLFYSVVDEIVSNRRDPALEVEGDLRAALVTFALQRMKVVFSSQHRQLLRLIVAERDRFPHIAHMYYEHGPKRSHDLVVNYMTQLRDRGLLDIDNPEESAEFLIGMLLHHWYLSQLYLQAPPPSEHAMRDRATHVVDRFLEAFGFPEATGKAGSRRREKPPLRGKKS